MFSIKTLISTSIIFGVSSIMVLSYGPALDHPVTCEYGYRVRAEDHGKTVGRE